MINFDRITDDIFVGSCPTNTIDVERLKNAGISAVLNLQTHGDFITHKIHWPTLAQSYRQHDISVRRVPIIDFDQEDLAKRLPQATHSLKRLIDNNHIVYVHCTAGVERSPATVVGYLARHKRLGLNRALSIVKSAHRCNPCDDALQKADTIFQTAIENGGTAAPH